MNYQPPFPCFGGKSAIADIVWAGLGDVPNFVEPFCGSCAVLLLRPHEPRIETINDADGLLANFWRALQRAPEAVAEHADNPVNECDLHARHLWLVGQRERITEKLCGDPDFYDAKAAGWWCWGACCWIGGGWCSGVGPWVSDGGEMVLSTAGRGVNRQRPHLGDAGRGECAERRAWLIEYLRGFADRLRNAIYGFDLFGEPIRPTSQGILADKFLVPPFSVLNAREGFWQERKRAWISLGIQSEIGRGTSRPHNQGSDKRPGTTEPAGRKADAKVFRIGDKAEWEAGLTAKENRLTWVPGDRAREELDEVSRKNLAANRKLVAHTTASASALAGGFEDSARSIDDGLSGVPPGVFRVHRGGVRMPCTRPVRRDCRRRFSGSCRSVLQFCVGHDRGLCRCRLLALQRGHFDNRSWLASRSRGKAIRQLPKTRKDAPTISCICEGRLEARHGAAIADFRICRRGPGFLLHRVSKMSYTFPHVPLRVRMRDYAVNANAARFGQRGTRDRRPSAGTTFRVRQTQGVAGRIRPASPIGE